MHHTTWVWANGVHSAIEFYVILLVMLLVVFLWVEYRKAIDELDALDTREGRGAN